MVKSIEFVDEVYGTLVLYYSLDKIKEQIRFALVITLAILVISTAVVFLLSVKLDIFITGPILELKDTAKKISHVKDYSIRAARKYSDEIGELVDVFNRMLKEIQTRDEKLACQNTKLESRVRQRTLELSHRNPP